MNELKVKIEVEKKIVVPQLTMLEYDNNNLCVLDDNIVDKNCGGIQCEDCICNIDNISMLANSQKLQLL